VYVPADLSVAGKVAACYLFQVGIGLGGVGEVAVAVHPGGGISFDHVQQGDRYV
jgi:hypothetical protein